MAQPKLTLSGYGATNYVGQALAFYRQYNNVGTWPRTIQIDHAVMLFKQDDIKIIMIQYSGFICHPRSDSFPGGITPDGKSISTIYDYPLVDNDHGSFILTPDGKSPPTWKMSRTVENYGNIDWVGKNNVVYSFRGPAGRQIDIKDATVNYSGFTVPDYTDGGGTDYFTPYQNKTYQGGSVDHAFPAGTKVLGACSTATILGVDYANSTNPDGGANGFYVEVWKDLKTRIGYKRDSRPSTPWFFNQSGTEAVNGNQKVIIAPDGKSVEFVGLSGSTSGTQQVTISTDWRQWALARTGSFHGYRDYNNDTMVDAQITTSQNQSTQLSLVGDTKYEDFPIMYTGVPPTSITVFPILANSQFSYTIDGAPIACKSPQAVWTFSNGTISNDGHITSVTRNCGTATVTATLSGLGWTLTGSYQFRMPLGVWVLQSDTYWAAWDGVYPIDYYVGVLRIQETNNLAANVTATPGDAWNALYHICTAQDCWQDMGFPPGVGASMVLPSVNRVDSSGHGPDGQCGCDWNVYNIVGDRKIYTWECA